MPNLNAFETCAQYLQIFFSVHQDHPKSVHFSAYRDLTARYRKKLSQVPFVQQLLFVFQKIVFFKESYLISFLVLVHRVMGIELVLTLTVNS